MSDLINFVARWAELALFLMSIACVLLFTAWIFSHMDSFRPGGSDVRRWGARRSRHNFFVLLRRLNRNPYHSGIWLTAWVAMKNAANSKDVEEILLQLLKHGINNFSFLMVLCRVYRGADPLLPLWDRWLTESDPRLQRCALLAFAAQPQLSMEHRIRILALMLNSHGEQRIMAARTYLGGLSQPPPLDVVMILMHDKQWPIRVHTVQALSHWEDERYLKLLEDGLHDPVWWVRYRSARSLRNWSRLGWTALRRTTASPDAYAADMARDALEDMSIEGVVSDTVSDSQRFTG